jgi:hypothetical protein
MSNKVGIDDYLAQDGSVEDLEAAIVPLEAYKAGHGVHAGGRPPSQATQLVALAEADELFHDEQGEPWVTVTVADHKETYGLRSRQYRRSLAQRFYMAEHTTPNSKALQDALNVLEGKAAFDGPEHRVHTRIAEHDGAIYVDLANDGWQAVQIRGSGWRVVDHPPVKFHRPKGMLPLPIPERDGSIDTLERYVNIKDRDDWRLLISWLVISFFPSGPYPVLIINGPQGSAKSTLVRLLRLLLDPNAAPLRAEPRELRDLMIAATNGWVVSFDNLSYLKPDLSDAICRLATGGGFGTRELYTDGEEMIFDAQRPVILNGIGDLASRGDLLDRAILLTLPDIPDDKRQTETKFWQAFEADQPLILGALLDAVSASIRNQSSVRLARMPRMADFAVRAAAAAPALGWTTKDFISAYDDNRTTGHAVALEASPLVVPIQNLVETGDWTGTAAELLESLNKVRTDLLPSGRGWPTTPKGLSEAVRRLAPNLAVVGVTVEFFKEGNRRRRRLITIRRTGGDPPPKGGKRASGPSKSVDRVDAGWTQRSAAASTPSTLVVDGVDGVDAGNPSSGGTDSEDDDTIELMSSPSSSGFPASNGNLRPHRPHRPPLEGKRVDAEPASSSTPSTRASTLSPVQGSAWESFVIALLREMPGLNGKGLSRRQLLAVLGLNCRHVADKRTGPSRYAPTEQELGSLLDHQVADGKLAATGDPGQDVVYRWTERGLAELSPKQRVRS